MHSGGDQFAILLADLGEMQMTAIVLADFAIEQDRQAGRFGGNALPIVGERPSGENDTNAIAWPGCERPGYRYLFAPEFRGRGMVCLSRTAIML